MSHSPRSSLSTPPPVDDDSTSTTQISPPRAPPTPLDSDTSPRITSNAADFPTISTASSSPTQSSLTSFPSQGHPTFASVVSSPSAPSLPTSVSSPAWFPAFDATSPEFSRLIPSSSSATLVESCLSPPSSPPARASSSPCHSSPQTPVDEIKPSTLDQGEIASQISDVEVLMKKLDLQDISLCKDSNAGAIVDESHVLPAEKKSSPSPPRAPSRPTIPLPPIDSESPHFPTRQRENSARPRKNSVHEPSAPAVPDPDKTPNVYINGLPPNFPEDQLFALAAPFGEVRSVRSFTRHVGDTETGYGFVLFETIASAEKCINSLRRYRNLHPTFSKVHKIPGTMYSQPRQTSDHGVSTTPSASSLAGWEQESAGDGSADSTFKAKMERLADRQSTNLYIEGLPLSIDEPTLTALVSPYSIRSSRFFQTKLSSPPRIIAFVRLETRAAAEEIIERLHGRMVRGWNDPGSRISVRFADTSEQRELRRAERVAREGEQASNQLSIAQATLLNLRGKELHSRPPMAAPPIDDYSERYSQFQLNGYPQSDFEVDYSRVPARYPQASHTQQPISHYGQQSLPAHPSSQRMNPAMASLLESLQASDASFQGRDVYAQDGMKYHSLRHQQQLASIPSDIALNNNRAYVPQGLGIAQAQAQGHRGYTATEEFILRARSNSLPQKRRPIPLDLHQGRQEVDSASANINMGVRGYRAQASTVSFPHQQHGRSHVPAFDPHDSMDEEDFHASTAVPHQMHVHRAHQQFDSNDRIMNQLNAHSLHTQHTNNNLRIPHSHPQQHQHLPVSARSSHEYNHHARIPLSNQQAHHYQHSLSGNPIANPRNMNNRSAQATNMNSNNIGNPNGIYRDIAQRGTTRHNGNHNGYSAPQMYPSHSDSDQSSPPLVSPALTYSSRSSTAFSPTTPFFGSFDEDETFRAPPMEGKAKKIGSRGATR